MRCVAITCARNEADIIEPFVRHTLAFCGQLIVLDHGSTDSTPGILRKLQEEELPVHVIRDATPGRMQVDQMNNLLRMAAADFAADWIFCLDADEFLSAPGAGSFLPAQVDEATPCLKLRVRVYYCREDDPADVRNPVERITRRLARAPETEDPSLYKVFIPGSLARQAGAHLVSGSHRFRVDGIEPPYRTLEDVWLGHFSLRSPASTRRRSSQNASRRSITPRPAPTKARITWMPSSAF